MYSQETERTLAEYKRRDLSASDDIYSLSRAVNLFFQQGRTRQAHALLSEAGFFPCKTKAILEIGCGARGWLPEFESWGVSRSKLAGIDLMEDRVEHLQRILTGYSVGAGIPPTGGADIRVGDASSLPWSSHSFDVVVQSTVFTSILSERQKQLVAAEMLRVAKSDGLIVWYDFVYNNPGNPNVRGIKLLEVKKLFPNCFFRSRYTTLAPPLARALVPRSWLLAEIAQSLGVLNTHLVAVIKCPRLDTVVAGAP